MSNNKMAVRLAALVVLLAVLLPSEAALFDLSVQKAPRINLPFFGIGVKCNGCPARSCEDDHAVVYGYCCGCSRFLDKLPVICHKAITCPLNGAGLCHDYEYMMRCCC